jgi:hypothetical protein
MTTTKETRKNANGFSVEDCTRCHGTGKYSFNQVDGDKCYGCNGSGLKLTRKAAKAWKAYQEAAEAAMVSTCGEAKVGDRIKVGGMMTTYRWMTIANVEDDHLNAGRIMFTTTKGNRMTVEPGMKCLNYTTATDAPNIADYAV